MPSPALVIPETVAPYNLPMTRPLITTKVDGALTRRCCEREPSSIWYTTEYCIINPVAASIGMGSHDILIAVELILRTTTFVGAYLGSESSSRLKH